MKKFFARSNFRSYSFNKKQKIQYYVVFSLLILFFILSSFTFFNALYCFVNELGSIVSGSSDVALRDFTRSLPVILSFLMSLWALLLFHALYRNVSDEKRIKSLKKNGITLIILATFTILYVIIMRFTGKYVSLVEGSPSAIYPLDSVLYSLIYLALGIYILIYLKKLQDKKPYLVPTNDNIVKKNRVMYDIALSIWLIVALYSFSAFFIGGLIMNAKEHLFYRIALMLCSFVGFVFLAFWELYYNNLNNEKRKELLLPLSIIGTASSLITSVIYIIALSLDKYAPSNIGFGVLPITFAASINLGELIVVFAPLIISLVILINGIVSKVKNKAETKE